LSRGGRGNIRLFRKCLPGKTLFGRIVSMVEKIICTRRRTLKFLEVKFSFKTLNSCRPWVVLGSAIAIEIVSWAEFST
jgi:hypothetical protein